MFSIRALAAAVLLLLSFDAGAQSPSGTLDKIIAVVGRNRIILQSDLEVQAAQMQEQYGAFTDSMKCDLLQQLMISKLLVEQAERDSLLVSEEELDATLENRIRYFIQRYGSKEAMEQASGKTVYQIKDENRDLFREQLMAQKMQEKLMENVHITPAEINAFYAKLAQDSLPYFPATIEVGEIVIDPSTTAEVDLYTRTELEKLRKQILDSVISFETAASINSEDPGTRDNGGLIQGVTRDGELVQEFISNSFRLQPGEISPVFKTQFGYHIIQMVRRKGEEVDVRHILRVPPRTTADIRAALARLDSARAEIISGKVSFSEAVGKYSTDQGTKMTGGMITDGRNGSAQMTVEQLDPGIALMIDSLQVGQYSQPHTFKTPRGETSTRIVYLKSRTLPHQANLRDDYSRIQAVALEQKKNEKLNTWVKSRLPSYYIKIDPQFGTCGQLRDWHNVASK